MYAYTFDLLTLRTAEGCCW